MPESQKDTNCIFGPSSTNLAFKGYVVVLCIDFGHFARKTSNTSSFSSFACNLRWLFYKVTADIEELQIGCNVGSDMGPA